MSAAVVEAMEARQLLSTVTVAATADAHVQNDLGTTNFGTDVELMVKRNTGTSLRRETFVRFDTPDMLSVSSAKIRLYGSLKQGTASLPIIAQSVSSLTWSETGITWNNKPAAGATTLDTETLPNATDAWYEWDVTSYVQSELAAGKEGVSFVLKANNDALEPGIFNSREAASNQPQLVISGTPREDVVLDNSDWDTGAANPGVTNTGFVPAPGILGRNEWSDANTAKGSRSVVFAPTLVDGGRYDVYGLWTTSGGRSTSVPISVAHANGTANLNVNQQATGGDWYKLGTWEFVPGSAGTVTISNMGTTGFVSADAVKFVPVELAPGEVRLTGGTSAQLSIAWDDRTVGETGFSIERKSGGGSYSVVGTVGANVTSFTNSSLTANTTYTYRVRATGEFTASTPSYSGELIAITAPSGKAIYVARQETELFRAGRGPYFALFPRTDFIFEDIAAPFNASLGTIVSTKATLKLHGSLNWTSSFDWTGSADDEDFVDLYSELDSTPQWRSLEDQPSVPILTLINYPAADTSGQYQYNIYDTLSVTSPTTIGVSSRAELVIGVNYPAAAVAANPVFMYEMSVSGYIEGVYVYTPI